MFFLVLWIAGLISGIAHIITGKQPVTFFSVSEILLLYQFVITFGLCGVIGLVVNILLAKKNARKTGWPHGPFQYKYGFTQLGLGVFGIMAIWFRGYFWIAALLNMYLYGLSGLYTHTREMMINKKPDANNVSNIVICIVYQAFLTLLSINAKIW